LSNYFQDDAVGPNDLLYFADICAGPGGFSEYILWRKKWKSKGFGFTLKGMNIIIIWNMTFIPMLNTP